MPSGGYQITQPGKPQSKTPAKKKAAPKPSDSQTNETTKPIFVKGRGHGTNAADQRKGKKDFINAVRTVADPVNRNFVTPMGVTAKHDWQKARPYTPIPTFERAAKAVLPGPGGVISRAAPALDPGTAISALLSIPRTLTTPIHPGQTTTPAQNIKRTSTAELAAQITAPSVPHYKIGHAEMSAPYQQYFAGKDHASRDEIAEATNRFANTPGSEVAGVPWPLSKEATMADMRVIKKNGWDIGQAGHWTFDEFVAKYMHKNERSVGGYLRNTAGGITQMAGIPSALVAGGGAIVSGLGGNEKPADDLLHQTVEFVKESNPLDPKAWYQNTPAVLANVLPAVKGASALGGRALLKAGERETELPSVTKADGTPLTVSQHVPADLIERALFETKRALIQNPRPGPGGAVGRRLEHNAETKHTENQAYLAELRRDHRLLPVMHDLQQAVRDTANRTRTGRGAGPFTTLLQPGKYRGGSSHAVAIMEQARTGMSAEDLHAWRRRLAQDWRDNAASARKAAEEHRQEAQIAEADGDYRAAMEHQKIANKLEEGARGADQAAHNNDGIAELHETNRTEYAGSSLVHAVVKASDLASDFKQEMSKIDEEGVVRSGLTDRARRFGNLESMLRSGERELRDPGLQAAARSDDTQTAFDAGNRLRQAEDADEIMRKRAEHYGYSEQAQARRGIEDSAGRSHAEREAQGGVRELERVSDRQVGHLDTESRAMVEPRNRRDRRTALTHEEQSPTVSYGGRGGYRDPERADLEGRRQAIQDQLDAGRRLRADEVLGETPKARGDFRPRRVEGLDNSTMEINGTRYKIKVEDDGVATAYTSGGLKSDGTAWRWEGPTRPSRKQAVQDAVEHARTKANESEAETPKADSHQKRTALKKKLAGIDRQIEEIKAQEDRINAPRRTETPNAPLERHPIEANPYGEHEGLAPSEVENVRSRLGDIAERHINRERKARLKAHNDRIATIERELGAEDLSDSAREAWQKRKDAEIEKFNTPSPRTLRRIEVSIDAYLKKFGKRLTDREKRVYREEVIKRMARITQSRGDLKAAARRERILETRRERERAASSRQLQRQADLTGQQYDALMEAYERHYGRGAHVSLVQEEVQPGGLRAAYGSRSARAGRGLRPRTRNTRVQKSEGIQTTRGAYSPEATARSLVNQLRSLADHRYSNEFRDMMLDSGLVKPSDGMAYEHTPEGWHWVSADNLMKWSSHPLHVDSSELLRELVDEGGAGLKHGVYTGMRKEVAGATKPRALIPDEPGFLIRESALKQFDKMLQRHESGDFGLFTEITNTYRKLLLFTLPRTFTNNMIGNIGLSLLSGAGMGDILRAAHAIRNHPEVLPSLIRNRGLIASQFGPDAALGGWMDMWRRANTFAEDLGQAATYMSQLRAYGKRQGLSVRGINGMLAGMDDLSSEWGKLMTGLAKGENPDVLPLMRKSKQFFGDIAKQTSVNKVLSTSILFHRWLFHVVKTVTATLPLHYPGRWALLIRLGQLGDDYRKKHGVLPDWAGGVVRLALEHVKMPDGTIQNVILGLGTSGTNPADSFGQVVNLGSESNPVFPGMGLIGGSFSPVVSVPFSLATGINPQTGRRFRDRYGNEMGPDETLQLLGHLGWANAPLISTGISTAGTSGDSQIWNQAPAATSAASYRRQLANPAMIHASSPKGIFATILRTLGIPLTRLDSYGVRYNQHLASLAYALEQDEKDQHNKDLKPKTPPKPAGPAPKPSKPLTSEQIKAKQKAYAQKVKAGGGQSAAKIKAAQKAYAQKVKQGG